MSEITGSTKNLDYIVHAVLADLGENHTRNYAYYLHWAFAGFRDLNLYGQSTVKTKWITMSDTNTICLPDDFVDYISVGITLCGRVFLLSLNDSMSPQKCVECPVPIDQIPAKNFHGFDGIFPYYYFFSGAFRGGQYVGEQFAMGGGWNSHGYFKIDRERKEIQFKSVVPRAEIVLEYLSTGIECDGTVEVPYAAVPAIQAYIHWQKVEHDQRMNPKVQLDKARAKERLYGIEFKNFRKRKQKFSVSEYLENKYKVSKATPTR